MPDEPLTHEEKAAQEKMAEGDAPEKSEAKKGKLDLKKHLIKVQGGRLYLPISARLVAFRYEHPDWSVKTTPFQLDWEKQWAVFYCEIRDANGTLMATGHKREDIKGFGDYFEKAETGSIGRALGILGYGTEYLTEFNEVTPEQAERGEGRFADSPKRERLDGPPEGEARERPQARREQPPEARQAAPAPRQPAPSGQQGNAPPPACVECGKAMTKAQAELSVRNYGGMFCPTHQKDKERLPQGEAARRQPAPAGQSSPDRPVNGNGDQAGQVGAMQGKIKAERKRIWGDTMDGDPPYRDWLRANFNQESLAGQPLRLLNNVYEALRTEPVFDDPFADEEEEVAAAQAPHDPIDDDPFADN